MLYLNSGKLRRLRGIGLYNIKQSESISTLERGSTSVSTFDVANRVSEAMKWHKKPSWRTGPRIT